MKFTTYTQLPPEAKALREEVFCQEQGFQEEFDSQDQASHHGLLWDDQGEAVKELGGREIRLHAQVRAEHFYETLGYQAYGPVEPDEGVLHQWMKKQLE